jgi:hypothetical protein
MKIHPVEAKFLHVDRYTDRHDENNNQFILQMRLQTISESWWGADTAKNWVVLVLPLTVIIFAVMKTVKPTTCYAMVY